MIWGPPAVFVHPQMAQHEEFPLLKIAPKVPPSSWRVITRVARIQIHAFLAKKDTDLQKLTDLTGCLDDSAQGRQSIRSTVFKVDLVHCRPYALSTLCSVDFTHFEFFYDFMQFDICVSHTYFKLLFHASLNYFPKVVLSMDI